MEDGESEEHHPGRIDNGEGGAVREEFRDWERRGRGALQAYLTETRDDLQRLIGWAERSGRRITGTELGEGGVLGIRDRDGAAEGVAGAGLQPERTYRLEFRTVHDADAGAYGQCHSCHRHPQRPLPGRRTGGCGAEGSRRCLRIPNALRHGRTCKGRPPEAGPPGPGVCAHGRTCPGDGLSGPPAPGEQFQRRVPPENVRRTSGARRAAGRSRTVSGAGSPAGT